MMKILSIILVFWISTVIAQRRSGCRSGGSTTISPEVGILNNGQPNNGGGQIDVRGQRIQQNSQDSGPAFSSI